MKLKAIIFCLVALIAQTSSGMSAELVSRNIDGETILITRGFPYRSDATVHREFTMEIEEVKGGVFSMGKSSTFALVMPGGGGLTFGCKGAGFFTPLATAGADKKAKDDGILSDAVGCKWVFPKPGVSFAVGGNVFKSEKKGAFIKFTKEGVVVNGFQITKAPK